MHHDVKGPGGPCPQIQKNKNVWQRCVVQMVFQMNCKNITSFFYSITVKINEKQCVLPAKCTAANKQPQNLERRFASDKHRSAVRGESAQIQIDLQIL